MGLLGTLAVYGAVWAIGKLIEWTDGVERPEFPAIKLPLVEEGTSLALCYGRARLDAPFLGWWGDVLFEDITDAEPLDMRITLQVCLGIGVDNMNLWGIQSGDAQVWSGDARSLLDAGFVNSDGSVNIAGPPDTGSIQHVWGVDDTPSDNEFINQTSNFNTPGNFEPFTFTAAEAAGDYCAFGHTTKFQALRFQLPSPSSPLVVGTDGAGSAALVWEYWNGSAWTALSSVVDGTIDFKSSERETDQYVTWAPPSDWATRTINGTGLLYWVRARLDSGTYTTNPTYSGGGSLSGAPPLFGEDIFGASLGIGEFQAGNHKTAPGYTSGFGIRWYPGSFTQGTSLYLTGGQDPSGNHRVSAYRGTSYVMFMLNVMGFGPNVPPWNFDCGGFPDALNGAPTRAINGEEANGVEVIYDILTNVWGRAGMDTSLIDTTSFTTAVTTVHGEGAFGGVAGTITRGRTALDVIREILFQLDAILYFDPFVGKVKIKLIRNDYTPAGLPVFDQSHLQENGVLDYQTSMYDDLVNTVKVTFQDRDSNYKDKTALVHDMALFYGTAQRPNVREFRLPWCKDAAAAMEIATRELKLLALPLRTARLAFNREVFDLLPGAVFKWTHPDYSISEKIMRVVSVDYGTLDDGRITVVCVEDRFALQEQVYDPPTPTTLLPLTKPVAAADQFSLEMPQWMGYRAEVDGLVPNRDFVRIVYLGKRPSANEIGFRPEVSEDSGLTYVDDAPDPIKPFAQVASVAVEYARTNEPYDTTTGLIVEAFSENPGEVLQTRSVANIRAGSNLIVAKTAAGAQEIIAYETFTVLYDQAAAEVWAVDDTPTGTQFIDETTDFNDVGDADFTPFTFTAAEAPGDWCAFGFANRFGGISFDNANGTAGVGGAGEWEYWNGFSWVLLSGVTDGTNGFTTAVADGQVASWSIPQDWAKRTINGGASLYFVRFKLTTAYSTNPVYDQGFLNGRWRLNNVWRSILDTSAITLPVGTELWFLDDPAIWLEALGKLGFDGDEALQIRLRTTTGLFSLDTGALTPETLQLAKRSILPYPADEITVGQIPAVIGDSGAVNEFPGSPVEGLSENWVVAPELVWFGNRRYRKQESIRRGDDADEDPDETPLGPTFGATTFDLDVDADGGGFVNIGNASDDQSPHSLENVAFSTAASSEAARVRTKRADPAGDRYSFTAPEVRARIAEYREILVNPGFDDATDGRGWSTVSGTPAYTSGSGSLGFSGKHLRSSSGTTTIEQVRKVSGIAGKDLHLSYYRRDFSGGTNSVRVQCITEDSGGGDLDTADTGTISASQNHWDRGVLTIPNVNASAVQIRIIVTVIESVGGGQDGAIDRIGVRVSTNLSGEQLGNGTLNSDLAGWTATNMIHATTNKSEGAGYATGTNGATCQLYRDTGTIPGGFGPGDVAWLRCRVRTGDTDDEVTVTLEARSITPTVLRTATTGVLTFSDTDWHEIDLYLSIPNSTDHFRVIVDGTEIGAAAAPAVDCDDLGLRLFDLA